MPIIKLTTAINAPIELVFDLSRSIDLHMLSLDHTNEKAIAGRTTGLVEAGESVTWEAKHLGIKQRLTSKITDVNPNYFFADEMLKGAFKSFRHEHHFEKLENEKKTIMRDTFTYTSPLGFLGRLVDKMFLENYMTQLLIKRNKVLKKVVETGTWKTLPEMEKHLK